MTTLPEAALTYAAFGWPVIAVVPRGKVPMLRRGLHDASTDPQVITRWWDRWPDANIGVVTGAPSRLVVLDVDGREGREALITMLRRDGRELPPTRWVRSPNGRHAYFGHPGGHIPNTAGRVAPHVDTRGDGGYVVAPPSRGANGLYVVDPGPRGIAPLPDWLRDLIVPPRREIPEQRTVSSRYAEAALTNAIAAVAAAPVGQRNHTLNAKAFTLGGFVVSGMLAEGQVAAGLLRAAITAGLSEREATRTIQSGLAAGTARPREITQRPQREVGA